MRLRELCIVASALPSPHANTYPRFPSPVYDKSALTPPCAIYLMQFYSLPCLLSLTADRTWFTTCLSRALSHGFDSPDSNCKTWGDLNINTDPFNAIASEIKVANFNLKLTQAGYKFAHVEKYRQQLSFSVIRLVGVRP